ncbi:MAG: hypothetical protein EOP06_05475, partial [Proteobacteria bacterium]
MRLRIFLSLFISASSFASDPCSELSAQQLLKIQPDAESIVVACGEDTNGPISDLTVLNWRKGDFEHVFVGDAAMKSYVVSKVDKSLVVRESLSTSGSKPFIETR